MKQPKAARAEGKGKANGAQERKDEEETGRKQRRVGVREESSVLEGGRGHIDCVKCYAKCELRFVKLCIV